VNAASWAIVPAFLVAGAGVIGLVRAGRLEAAGRLADARAVARRSGFVAGAGSVAVATLTFGLTLPIGARFAVAGLILACGATSLLAGLAGKPRPSSGFAVVFVLAAAFMMIAVNR
jgi:hypothetical protein